MKKVIDYLEMYKKIKSIKSDGKLAKEMNIGRWNITRVRKGEINSIAKERYIKIAKELQIHPLEIIATIEAEKTKDKEMKKIWIELAEEKGKN